MAMKNPYTSMHGLTTAQASDLGARLKTFWDGLTSEEQAHLDGALRRLIDEGGDVSGHGLIDYSLVLYLIVIVSTF